MTQAEIIIELTKMQYDDLTRMRPCDIDRSTDPWEYRVPGTNRIVFIGQTCQKELGPLLDAATENEQPLFTAAT